MAPILTRLRAIALAPVHVGKAQHPRRVAHVEKGRRVKRIGIRRRERSIRIFAEFDDLTIGARVPSGLATLVIIRRVISIVTSG